MTKPLPPSEAEARECPFCGSPPQSIEGKPSAYNTSYNTKWPEGRCRVHCSNGFLAGGPCSAVGPMAVTAEEAIRLWNTRATLPPQERSGDARELRTAVYRAIWDPGALVGPKGDNQDLTDWQTAAVLAALRSQDRSAPDQPTPEMIAAGVEAICEGAQRRTKVINVWTAMRAVAPLASRSAPDGWVLVPREPTEGMASIFYKARNFDEGWKSALAAAPPALSGEGVE